MVCGFAFYSDVMTKYSIIYLFIWCGFFFLLSEDELGNFFLQSGIRVDSAQGSLISSSFNLRMLIHCCYDSIHTNHICTLAVLLLEGPFLANTAVVCFKRPKTGTPIAYTITRTPGNALDGSFSRWMFKDFSLETLQILPECRVRALIRVPF